MKRRRPQWANSTFHLGPCLGKLCHYWEKTERKNKYAFPALNSHFEFVILFYAVVQPPINAASTSACSNQQCCKISSQHKVFERFETSAKWQNCRLCSASLDWSSWNPHIYRSPSQKQTGKVTSALPTALMWLVNHILFSLLMIIPHEIQCDLINK